jgi:hypothetical protein
MSSTKNPTPGLKEGLDEFFNSVIKPPSIEFFRLLPDGLILGTAILSIISFCKSYGFLLMSMVELMLLQRIISAVIANVSPIIGGPNMNTPTCQTGFMYKNLMRVSVLETIGQPSYLPSPTMFFASGVLSYMVGAIQEFKREITTLGGDISNRNVLVMIFSSIFLIALFAFRSVYGCEEFGPLLLSVIFGAIAGFVVMYQNKSLFGRDSINLLNLPMIVTAVEMGKPMYVCGPSP